MSRDGVELATQERRVLEHIGKQNGLLGLVFRSTQSKVQDPSKLKRLISNLLNKVQRLILDAEIKGDVYEGLLERR